MRMQLSSWIAASCLTLCSWSQVGFAGPWIDSILNRRPAYPVGVPYAANYGGPANYGSVVSNYGTYASPAVPSPSNSGYGPIPLGVPQTVAGTLPTAGYDTTWNRVPVTYYRPVTSFSPQLGTTVTSLQPCTSYQYQANRVPYLAPRPIGGEYGLHANPWPGITGPGYNPTALGVSASYPGNFAPYGTTGASIGMPASSLPITTIPTQPSTVNYGSGIYNSAPVTSLPAYSTPTVSPMATVTVTPLPSTFTPYSTPTYSTPITSGSVSQSYMPPTTSLVPGQSWTGTQPWDNSSVVPAASIMPNGLSSSSPVSSYSTPLPYATSQPVTGGCASGSCPLPSNSYSTPVTPYASPSNAPNIPDARVIPLGPPTYAPVPANPLPSATPLPGASPLPSPFPPGSVMPPSGGVSPGIADPESTVVPSRSSNASVQRATIEHLVNNVPSSPNSQLETRNIETDSDASKPELHGGMLPWNRKEIDSAGSTLGSLTAKQPDKLLSIPDTLKPKTERSSMYHAKPLRAPVGVDTKATWTPDLVDSDDPVAENRSKSSDQPSQRIEEASNVRFISGSFERSRKQPVRKETSVLPENDYDKYFHPITPSK